MPSAPSPAAPVLAVVGGGQLARMMAQPAIALGLPLRLLAEAAGVSAAQVIPATSSATTAISPTLRRLAAAAPSSRSTTSTSRPSTCRRWRRTASRCRPGPDALVHAQDKAVMRERLTGLGVPCPRHAVVATPPTVERVRLPGRAEDHAGGYDGKGVWVVARRRLRRGLRGRGAPACG